VNLLFRIALGYSMAFWLQCTIQQQRPCQCNTSICFISISKHSKLKLFIVEVGNIWIETVLGSTYWGMPSINVVTGNNNKLYSIDDANEYNSHFGGSSFHGIYIGLFRHNIHGSRSCFESITRYAKIERKRLVVKSHVQLHRL
jgi:hypothetical protein